MGRVIIQRVLIEDRHQKARSDAQNQSTALLGLCFAGCVFVCAQDGAKR